MTRTARHASGVGQNKPGQKAGSRLGHRRSALLRDMAASSLCTVTARVVWRFPVRNDRGIRAEIRELLEGDLAARPRDSGSGRRLSAGAARPRVSGWLGLELILRSLLSLVSFLIALNLVYAW